MEQVLSTHRVSIQDSIPKPRYRIDSIDLLRGLVMIIMALDHTRDFFHKDGMTGDPTNLATTTPLLFFTRWITHFCAPTFVFLAGTSAWFQSLRKSKGELSIFLIKRGLWLILLELTLINFSFSFDLHFSVITLQTIWSIGISMVVLGLMIWLPFAAIAALGFLVVLGHNALDYYEAGKTNFTLWYSLLHAPGFHPISKNYSLIVLYPFLAWAGLMMLGYCFGKLFTAYEGSQRKKRLATLGAGVVLLFIVLRWSNVYGNPEPWAPQKDGMFTLLSFLNTHKYPPSLLYMCMTIGPAILFLAFAGKSKGRLSRIITVYGRVPFFYYILHFFLIHILSSIAGLLRGHSLSEGIHTGAGIFAPNFMYPGEGYSLWVVYAMWLFVVAVLYYPCKWFSQYKQTHKQWWLSYL